MEDKNKKMITLLIVFTIIFTIIGSTFAYLNWQTSSGQQTSVTFTVTESFKCAADGGNELNDTSVLLEPTECTSSDGNVLKREITLKPTINAPNTTVYMDIWLDVVKLDEGLKNSDNFKWVLSKSSTSCSGSSVVSSGTFKGLVENDMVKIVNANEYTETTTDKYYLYIWLDKEETSTSTMNQKFEFKLNGECTDLEPPPEPETPTLDDGLIPVILSDDATNGYKVTATTSSNPNWYNYDNKQWANAVLVKESGVKTRTQNKVPTTEINTNDILAYFVWIPRYAYQIWTLAESATGNEQQIAIEWESADASYRAGTQVDEYRTHPAFWRDNNSNNAVDDGETIAGIWVGKFETTQGTSSNVGTTNPTILPGISPWVSQNVSTQFQTGLKFAGGTLSNGAVTFSTTNSYGIGTTLTSHMMKNSEWGAVAYLSHSEYGRCQDGTCEEIRINNYKDETMVYPMTGCGALEENADTSTTCSNAYASGISAYPQSTTGNITGIFDMSGGVSEYVMGVFANSEGKLWSGYSTSKNSGFNGLLGTSAAEYTSGISFPTETKYYDKYQASSGTTISSLTACNGGICYGHGLSETKSWYGDSVSFVYSSYPWFSRGGNSHNGSFAGAFYFLSSRGAALSNDGFRSVLSRDYNI